MLTETCELIYFTIPCSCACLVRPLLSIDTDMSTRGNVLEEEWCELVVEVHLNCTLQVFIAQVLTLFVTVREVNSRVRDDCLILVVCTEEWICCERDHSKCLPVRWLFSIAQRVRVLELCSNLTRFVF